MPEKISRKPPRPGPPTPPPRAVRRRGPPAAGRAGSSGLPGLSRPVIVEAAFALVAEGGVAGLSTRKLGERLGCEAMSIYHHFPSKQHLFDALVDQVLGQFDWPPADLAPVERLRRTMYGYRAAAHRHPAFFPYLAVHRLNTRTGVRFIERVLGIVQALVPDAEAAARHFRIMGYYLVGAALDETAGYARGPSAADPVDGATIERECPRLAASARYFQQEHWDRTFELGVQMLLAAMAKDAAA